MCVRLGGGKGMENREGVMVVFLFLLVCSEERKKKPRDVLSWSLCSCVSDGVFVSCVN